MRTERVTCSVCGTKSTFPVLKRKYSGQMEKYPRFCPDPETLEEQEIKGVLQTCPNCGYVFPRIDEGTDFEKNLTRAGIYKQPFGAKFKGAKEAVTCYRVAMIYNVIGCPRQSAQWFIYSAVLLGNEYPEAQTKCYKNALVLLEGEIRKSYIPKNTELYLAYLNVMRLLGMYECVKEFGNEKKHLFRQLDKRLMETILWLADNEDSEYITYFDMLFLDIGGI